MNQFAMKNLLVLVMTFLSCGIVSSVLQSDCSVDDKVSKKTSLSIFGKRNSSGDSVTFSVAKYWNETSDDVKVTVNHVIVPCGGVQMILIEGTVEGLAVDEHIGELIFHNKCGRLVAVINNGYSAQKIIPKEHTGGGLLTNRPLRNNELFEVYLDKIFPSPGPSVGVGATAQSPDHIQIPDDMNQIRRNTWMYYDKDLWINTTLVLKNYGKNLNELKDGHRIGVMRSGTGALHFFVNGVDQGPAASNLPENVYGIIELRGRAHKATIIKPKK